MNKQAIECECHTTALSHFFAIHVKCMELQIVQAIIHTEDVFIQATRNMIFVLVAEKPTNKHDRDYDRSDEFLPSMAPSFSSEVFSRDKTREIGELTTAAWGFRCSFTISPAYFSCFCYLAVCSTANVFCHLRAGVNALNLYLSLCKNAFAILFVTQFEQYSVSNVWLCRGNWYRRIRLGVQ